MQASAGSVVPSGWVPPKTKVHHRSRLFPLQRSWPRSGVRAQCLSWKNVSDVCFSRDVSRHQGARKGIWTASMALFPCLIGSADSGRPQEAVSCQPLSETVFPETTCAQLSPEASMCVAYLQKHSGERGPWDPPGDQQTMPQSVRLMLLRAGQTEQCTA